MAAAPTRQRDAGEPRMGPELALGSVLPSHRVTQDPGCRQPAFGGDSASWVSEIISYHCSPQHRDIVTQFLLWNIFFSQDD